MGVGGGRGGLFLQEGDIRDTEAPRDLQVTPPACSQGLAAPSLAVLGPRGVALLVPACLFLSHGLGGAGLPAAKSSSLYKSIHSQYAEAYCNRPVQEEVREEDIYLYRSDNTCKATVQSHSAGV